MAKDRARPFSRKHRRYWLTVTGGMVFIGLINITIGYCTYTAPAEEAPEQIELHVRHRPYEEAASRHAPNDAGIDAPAWSEPGDLER